MSGHHFTASQFFDKPAKPYPKSALSRHNSGCWAKKIRGKLHDFGTWADPDAALAKYLEQKDDLHAGRTPRPAPREFTVKDAANAFLKAKRAWVDAGELAERTWREYKWVCDLLVSRLRQRLRDEAREPRYIKTLRSEGYVFSSAVSTVDAPE